MSVAKKNFFVLASLLVSVALSDHPRAAADPGSPHSGPRDGGGARHPELPDEVNVAAAARPALLRDGTGPAAQRWPLTGTWLLQQYEVSTNWLWFLVRNGLARYKPNPVGSTSPPPTLLATIHAKAAVVVLKLFVDFLDYTKYTLKTKEYINSVASNVEKVILQKALKKIVGEKKRFSTLLSFS